MDTSLAGTGWPSASKAALSRGADDDRLGRRSWSGPEHVRLDVDHPRCRDRCADPLLHGVDARRDVAEPPVAVDGDDLHATMSSSGPRYRVLRCTIESTSGPSSVAPGCVRRRRRSLPRPRAGSSSRDAEHDRHRDEEQGDQDRADRVEHPVAGDHRQPDAEQREHQAGQGRRVLEHDDGQLGRLRPAHELHPRLRPLVRAGLAQRRAEREALEPDRDDEHGDRQPPVLERVRRRELLEPLVQREDPADGEQDDRHDERVHVPFAPVAERVLLVGGLPRTPSAEQQQELVRGVGEGVHALREHRRGPADRRRDELDDRDPDVRGQCGEDRPRASRSAHRCPFSRRAPILGATGARGRWIGSGA